MAPSNLLASPPFMGAKQAAENALATPPNDLGERALQDITYLGALTGQILDPRI